MNNPNRFIKNKLYTKAYFIKRLKESETLNRHDIDVRKLVDYEKTDIRRWTIIIHNKISDNILITCFRKNFEDFWFVLSFKNRPIITLKTLSMKVIINKINEIIESDKNGNNPSSENTDKAGSEPKTDKSN